MITSFDEAYRVLRRENARLQIDFTVLEKAYRDLLQAGRDWVSGVDVYGPCAGCGECSTCTLAVMIEEASSSEPKKTMKCQACENGEVWVECCNGSSGCPCGGREIFFSECQACGGTGEHREGNDMRANLKAIQVAAALTGGYLGNPHGRTR